MTRKKKARPVYPEGQQLTKKGTPRLRRSKAMARAADADAYNTIVPHGGNGIRDDFWKVHGGHESLHANSGAVVSHEFIGGVGGDTEHPENSRMISRAVHPDGSIEERHLHGLTASTISFTHRMKAAGDTDFTESTTVLPNKKDSLASHVRSL